MFNPWFSDDLAELGTKDAQMQMAGVWCVEIAELTGMRQADIERVKAFASRRVDRYRPSYGRYVIAAPRQCICIGTTNSERYLKDETGGRRFWPVRCGRIDVAAVARDRDQLWAEAVAFTRRASLVADRCRRHRGRGAAQDEGMRAMHGRTSLAPTLKIRMRCPLAAS